MKKIYHKDGETRDRCFEEGTQPEGWILGRSPDKAAKSAHSAGQTGKHWITDGIKSKLILDGEPAPEGWREGRVVSCLWITDGIKSRCVSKSEDIPKGWILGRANVHSSSSKEKNRQAHLGPNNARYGTHWTDEQRAKHNATLSKKSEEEKTEWKSKISKAVKGTKWTSDAREAKSRQMKQLWQDPAYVAKQREAYNGWHGTSSKPEQEIADFVASIYNGTIARNDRTVIYPKELDIYIPEKRVAIEFDGLYWHSSERLSKDNPMLDKTNMCKALGIRLIHVREDQWRDKRDIVKSIIASSIGVYKERIYARKCTFMPISNKTANGFLDRSHVKGGCKCAKSFGLLHNGKLVQVVTFRAKFCNTKGGKRLELARMASLLDTQVLGGFSKLMKESLKMMGKTECESFVDLALFNCTGYASSGWTVLKESTGAGYLYTDTYNVYNRQMFMKGVCWSRWHSEYEQRGLGYGDVSEALMVAEHGLRVMQDCGNALVLFHM